MHKVMTRVLRDGLEGLVVKDKQSIYEPGARHWIKIKKDYLQGFGSVIVCVYHFYLNGCFACVQVLLTLPIWSSLARGTAAAQR
jgi:hypothetical protein